LRFKAKGKKRIANDLADGVKSEIWNMILISKNLIRKGGKK